MKITKGETVGYRLTDIIYPGELVESVGTPVTSTLDKVKNMLGNFEYFYDDDGRFVFQKKRTFVNESWNNIKQDGDKSVYVEDAAYTSPFEYMFEGNKLIASFSNSPQLTNVRNDFSIWGTKKSTTGNELPVHLRYAIDKKPLYYKTIDGRVYCSSKDLFVWDKVETFHPDWWDVLDWAEYYKTLTGEYPVSTVGTYCKEYYSGKLSDFGFESTASNVSVFDVVDGKVSYSHGRSCTHTYNHFIEKAQKGTRCYVYKPYIPTGAFRSDFCDWREIIYQMALDFRLHNHDDDYLVKVNNNNYLNGEYLYPGGVTGYQQYYTDMEGFWRLLYNPEIYNELYEMVDNLSGKEANNSVKFEGNKWKDAFLSDAAEGIKAMDAYILACKNKTEEEQDKDKKIALGEAIVLAEKIKSYIDSWNWDQSNAETCYWTTKIDKAPESLTFWFDFLDIDGELAQFSIPAIGHRPKAINDSAVKGIYFKETPLVVFVKAQD